MDKFAQALVGFAIVLMYLFFMGALARLGWYFIQSGWNLFG